MSAASFISGLLTSSATGGAIFLLSGKIMQRYPPRWPNYFYGYRTMAALQTKESFDAANVFSAALLVKYGSGLIVYGILLALFFNEHYWWLFLSAGMLAVIGCVTALIVKTEKWLALHFDKNGKQLP
jgi:uncharacterized membrane protein